MSLVKTEKKSNKKALSPLFKGVILMLLLFVSSITLVACDWMRTESGGGASFDADGKLRVSTPFVTFHPYTVYDDGYGTAKQIDDISGSFTWDLSYYLASAISGNESTLKTNVYDQISLGGNFYNTNSFTDDNFFPYEEHCYATPIYANNEQSVRAYYENQISGIVLSVASGTTFNASQYNYYAIRTINEMARQYEIVRVYSPAERVLDSIVSGNKSLINFSDFEVIIDGKYYYFDVKINPEYIGVLAQHANNTVVLDNGTRIDGTKAEVENVFYDKSLTDGDPTNDYSLFEFSYRKGKLAKGFEDCETGHMTYFTDPTTGKFTIRYNPQLGAGSTSRYLKVRAISNSAKRGDSVFSNTVAFNAYSFTFNAHSVNSSEIAYDGLIYDSDKFYFHTVKEAYDEVQDRTIISSLTGVFPEGKKIIVERTAPKTGNYSDYAFQSWTTNTKSENTIAYNETLFDDATLQSAFTLPAGDTYYDLIMSSRMDTIDSKNYTFINNIPGSKVTNSDAYKPVGYRYLSDDEVVGNRPPSLYFTYFDKLTTVDDNLKLMKDLV